MGPLLRAVVSVAALSSLAACGTGRTPLASEAARDVRQRSVDAGVAMSAGTPHGSPAAEYARAVVGGEGEAQRIELMEAVGHGRDGHVVLRISSAYEASGWGSASAATACYRFDFDETGVVEPDETGCPDDPPLALPPPFDPALPHDAAELLDAALRSADPATAVSESFTGPGLTALAHHDPRTGGTGLAVQASPGECVMGRREADGTISTWNVPRVVAMPGEMGCDPVAAAAGLGARSPH